MTLQQGTVAGEKGDDPVVEMRQLLKGEQHTAETVVREATGDSYESPEDAINAELAQTWTRSGSRLQNDMTNCILGAQRTGAMEELERGLSLVRKTLTVMGCDMSVVTWIYGGL